MTAGHVPTGICPEAKTIRKLFRLYLEQGTVKRVKLAADRFNLRTKMRKPNGGKRKGGEAFTRGHIHKLLSNPVYIGKIAHQGERHPGPHEAIVDLAIWDQVQSQLRRNAVARSRRTNAKDPSRLAV